MFRYTPPWQVLCNSLDYKRQASTVTSYSSCTRRSTEEHHGIHSHPSLRPADSRTQPRVPMASNPKLWVIKPFSPRLEQADLRSILSPVGQPQSPENTWSDSFRFHLESMTLTGTQPTVTVSSDSGTDAPDVLVQARQVPVSEDGSDSEDWRPRTPSSPGNTSSTSSHIGFYSFVEDPTSPEAEFNEVYMVSPERQAKLNTLKEKSVFKLQTYSEEKRPGKLFEETNGDDRYRIDDASQANGEEDDSDRMEIIRNQAPKKSPVLKKQWSALENLDLSKTPQRLMDGFSLRYNDVCAKAGEARVEPGTIDHEQIDFNTARKQFLFLEQSKPKNPNQLPYSPKLQGKTFSPMANIFTSRQESNENSPEENLVAPATQQEFELKAVTVTEDPEDGVVQSGMIDGDQSGYNSDGSISDGPAVSESGSNLALFSAEETPIQREIRISKEREESLRRSRGIVSTDNSEIVEIRIKPILFPSYPQVKAAKPNDANRVSFLIKRELELEKQRQIPHVQENRQVEDRKALKSKPDDVLRTDELERRTVSEEDEWITTQPVLVEKEDLSESREGLSPCCPHRHPDESILQRNMNSEPSKVRIYKENGVNSPIKKQPSWLEENNNLTPWKNRLFSPNSLPPSREPVKARYTPTWRSHLENTDWSPKLQNAPDSIRQEIEEDLKREKELQKLRESFSAPVTPMPWSPVTNSKGTVLSPRNAHCGDMEEVDHKLPEKSTDIGHPQSWGLETCSDKGPQLSSPQPSPRLPSVSMVTPQPWGSSKPTSPTVSQRTAIKPVSVSADVPSPVSQKGLTETLLKDFEDRRVKHKLEESAYAGIQPIDAINNEVVEATRVTRHKNQRALQWEAGMYNNQES